jgi:methionine-rich copper-binding protein CopC
MNGGWCASRTRDALAATLVTGVALLVVQVGGAGPAAAHASLVGVVPADGATVRSAPAEVTLRFDENIRQPSVVVVDGPDGKRVDHGSTTVLNDTASVRVRVRDPGPYTVAYRVLSADGHPVSGRTRFTFRDAQGSAAVQPARTEARSGTRLVVAGAAAALLVAGGLLLTGRTRRSRGRR